MGKHHDHLYSVQAAIWDFNVWNSLQRNIRKEVRNAIEWRCPNGHGLDQRYS